MKKFLVIIFILITLVVLPMTAFAQQQSESNVKRTRVGNPITSDFEPGSVPAPPSDIRQGIIDEFGITMNGFDNQHLQWAWERLWEVSDTKFPSLVRGATIQRWDNVFSAQVGCFSGLSLNLRQFPGQGAYFKFHFLHELGHVAQMCNSREATQRAAHENAYAIEGGISEYGKQGPACIPGTDKYNEDHADTIAYFLDRSAGFVTTVKCGGPSNPPNPYNNGGFPLRAAAMTEALLN